MGLSRLHRLAELIRHGDPIDDNELTEALGDEVIYVPLSGGGERRLPSGEILAVLAQGAGLSIDQVLARSFRLSPEEIETARDFISLVQFAGGTDKEGVEGERQEPIQPFER